MVVGRRTGDELSANEHLVLTASYFDGSAWVLPMCDDAIQGSLLAAGYVTDLPGGMTLTLKAHRARRAGGVPARRSYNHLKPRPCIGKGRLRRPCRDAPAFLPSQAHGTLD